MTSRAYTWVSLFLVCVLLSFILSACGTSIAPRTSYSVAVCIEGVADGKHSSAFRVTNGETLTFSQDGYDIDTRTLQGMMTLRGEVTLTLGVDQDLIEEGYYGVQEKSQQVTKVAERITFRVSYIEDGQDLAVTRVESIDAIVVDINTPFASLPLPDTVEVVLEDYSTEELGVRWQEGDYDGSTSRIYEISGDLIPTGNVINPDNVRARVNVSVLRENDTLLTPQRRYEVSEEVHAFIEDLPHNDFAAETEEIVSFLQSHPAFKAAGSDATGDTIWAVFNDNTLFFISEIGMSPEVQTDSAVVSENALAAHTRVSKQAIAPQRTPSNIPNCREYLLLNGLGNAFDAFNPIPEIDSMLSSAGYVGYAAEASLDGLRYNTNTGVLYIRTHGAEAELSDTNERRGALWTTVQQDPSLEVGLLADDIARQRVGYLRLYDRRGFLERTTHPTHYMITDLFIDEYWGNFPDNSLVYIDGCGVLTFGSVLNAISRKNNPVIFGWTTVVTVGVMQATSQFVFDRLLGANMFEAETPPQRPFDFHSVFLEHIGFGGRHGYCGQHGATLQFRGGGGFGLLAPSIKRMDVDEGKEELTIYGLFGEDKGAHLREVTIAGDILSVKSWSNDVIVVQGFTSEKDGEVVVEIDSRRSNGVPITSWRGWEVRYVSDLLSTTWEVPRETLRSEFIWQLDLRADVHSYRQRPGGEPVEPMVPFFQATQSSTGLYEHTGTATMDCNRGRLSGAGCLEWYDAGGFSGPVPDGCFAASGSIDMETKSAEFRPVFCPEATVGTYTLCFICDPPDSISIPFRFGHPPVLGFTLIDLQFDEYNIRGDEREEVFEVLYFKLEWSAISAQHAPGDDVRR